MGGSNELVECFCGGAVAEGCSGAVARLVGDGVLAVPGRGSSVAVRTPARKSFPRSASQFLYTVADLPGTRSTQAGRGMILPASGPRCQRAHAGPGGVGPGGATRLSSILGTRTPAKRAGSSDAACRHALIGDHTVFHAVASCRANPAMVAPLDAQLSDRPADRPRPQTRPGCAHLLAMFQECYRLAGA